jgi:amino acid transporter
MGDEGASAKRKIPATPLAAILVLSLVTWWFFYAQSMPLDPGATAVVVGIWAAVVVSSRWIWQLVCKKQKRRKEHQ